MLKALLFGWSTTNQSNLAYREAAKVIRKLNGTFPDFPNSCLLWEGWKENLVPVYQTHGGGGVWSTDLLYPFASWPNTTQTQARAPSPSISWKARYRRSIPTAVSPTRRQPVLVPALVSGGSDDRLGLPISKARTSPSRLLPSTP